MEKIDLIRSEIRTARKKFDFGNVLDIGSLTKNLKDFFRRNPIASHSGSHSTIKQQMINRIERMDEECIERGLIVQTL